MAFFYKTALSSRIKVYKHKVLSKELALGNN